MRKKKILMMLALLLTAVTGAWADEWATVYKQTQTKQSDWTALSAGSTTGRTLGSADAVTYYYASDNLSFTNSTAGGSGLTILGTVYLYIPSGKTVTCMGHDASGTTGAGAGIELTQGNSLYLIGGGTLVATGGNAANGGNGGKGNDAEVNTSNDEYILGGSGGTATAAAVPVLASAHAAAMAAAAAAAVNALDLILMRLRNMALMAMPAVPVVPLASWARSMFTKLWPPQ